MYQRIVFNYLLLLFFICFALVLYVPPFNTILEPYFCGKHMGDIAKLSLLSGLVFVLLGVAGRFTPQEEDSTPSE